MMPPGMGELRQPQRPFWLARLIRRRPSKPTTEQPSTVEPVQEPMNAERLFTLAHLWAQQTYYKGLGQPCDIDGARAAFENGLKALAQRAEPVQEPVACAWHGDEDGTYETSCKHIFQMIDGTPHENNFTHCCFCGKSLVQHQWEDGNDE